jgi:TonB family protein
LFAALIPQPLLSRSTHESQDSKPAPDTKPQAKSNAKSDEVYTAGGEVKAPKIIHYVEPDFSPSSQEAYVEGVVRLSAIVNTEGLPTELKIINGLNSEEDQTAMEALKQWRFKPGTKNGQAVRVKITVEINFHLL